MMPLDLARHVRILTYIEIADRRKRISHAALRRTLLDLTGDNPAACSHGGGQSRIEFRFRREELQVEDDGSGAGGGQVTDQLRMDHRVSAPRLASSGRSAR